MKIKKNISRNLLKLLILAVLFFSFAPGLTQAGLVPCGTETFPPGHEKAGQISNPCQFCDFFVLFDNIVKFILFKIVPPIAVLMVVIGGVLFFTAADNPANVGKARDLLKSVAISLLIIYGAWLLVNFFFLVIGVNVWTGLGEGWFKFPCP